jgi:hypothetical protein
MKLGDGQQHYVQIAGTDFHAHREINVDSKDVNLFASVSMAFTAPIFTHSGK